MPEAPPRPPRLALLLATGFGLGYCRPGPGTWASAAAALAGWGAALALPIAWQQAGLGALALALTLIGLLAAPAAARHFTRGDPSQVVIDELAGVMAGLALVPAATLRADPVLAVLAVFVLFRVFDIAKPWPVSSCEALPGALGIMADDLAAGLLAGILAAAILH